MSGHVGDLSRSQEEALRQFREAVAEIPNKPEEDDYYYLRWLRARKFNVKKAEEMFRKHMDFRKQYGADTILQDYTPPEVFKKYFPGGFFGEDKEGRPVRYDNFGNVDSRGLHRSATREQVRKHKCYDLELAFKRLKEQSAKHGRHIETMNVIIDFENLSIQKHYYWPGIETLKDILTMVEDNAPEIAFAIFMIKAPAILPMGYNLVKHVLDEKTRRKIHFLGSNWKEELQKYISPDQLPQAYGGTRCEPDPYCTDYINHGGDIPEKYYMTNLTEKSREEMERVVIGRGSAHKVTLEVDKSGSIIQWEFVTSEYDIAFSIYHQIREQKGKKIKNELIASQRKQSHIVPETGFHVCETSGKYILKFDNSYSWARSKEVFYSIKLLPPGTEPHLHVPPGEMEKAELGGHTPNSSPSSTHSSEFYDCDENGTEAQVSKIDETQTNGVNNSDEVKGACGTAS